MIIDKSDLNFLPTGPFKVVENRVTDAFGRTLATCLDGLVARAFFTALLATVGSPETLHPREKRMNHPSEWGPPWR